MKASVMEGAPFQKNPNPKQRLSWKTKKELASNVLAEVISGYNFKQDDI